MSKKVKNMLIALILIVIGFGFFTSYSFTGKGVLGVIAMVFVFGGVYFLVNGFSSGTKKSDATALYKNPKK